MGRGADLAPSSSGGGRWLCCFPAARAVAMFVSDCRREFYEAIVSQVRAGGRRARRHPGTGGGGAHSPQAAFLGLGVPRRLTERARRRGLPALAAEGLRYRPGAGAGAVGPRCPFFFSFISF